MTVPFNPTGEDEPLRARLRRAALQHYGFGPSDTTDPVQQIGLTASQAPRMGSGLYRTSEIADASVDRSPETARRQGRGQAIIDAALAGLSGLDPRSGGASGFIGSAVQAAGRTRGVYDRLTREPEQPDGALPDQLLRYAFSDDALPEWKKQGYPSFDEWRIDQMTHPTGQALAPRVIGTDADGNVTVMIGSEVRVFDKAGKPLDMRPNVIPGVVGAGNEPLGIFRQTPNELTPITTPGGAQMKPSAGQQDDLAAIDTSLKSLDDIDTALKGNEKAFSIGRQVAANIPFVTSLGRRIVTRVDAAKDPEFVKARSTVAILNSTIRKLQSGAAVTPYEGAVLESFLGDEWKDDAKSIKLKVDGVRRWVQNKRKSSTDTRRIGGGAAPAGDDGPPDDL